MTHMATCTHRGQCRLMNSIRSPLCLGSQAEDKTSMLIKARGKRDSTSLALSSGSGWFCLQPSQEDSIPVPIRYPSAEVPSHFPSELKSASLRRAEVTAGHLGVGGVCVGGVGVLWMEAKAILGDRGLSAQLEVETHSGTGHRVRYSQLTNSSCPLTPSWDLLTRTMGEQGWDRPLS